MSAGRVIRGDEHEARTAVRQLVEDARVEAARLRAEAAAAAARLLEEARAERARAEARAAHARAAAAPPRSPAGVADAPAEPAGTVEAERAESVDAEPAGTVEEVIGLVVRARIARVALGELVHIDRRDRDPLAAEVVGFRGEHAVLLPLGEQAGLAAAAAVWRTGAPLQIRCGDDLLGRVVDGIGAPIDGGPALAGELWAVDRPAPEPLARPPIREPQPTGVTAIDALVTLGRGQRVGLFAAAGTGKTTLLGQIARGARADVIVLCQVGERGRELGELLGEELAPSRARTVAVCATSDAPPLVRLRAAHTATAIAEWFRDRRGAQVLLLCDSLTRVARAQREVGLSAGEPPARHGYPPSVFALLPRLIERAGPTPRGAITAIYTVLVAGNDLDEPIADEVRGLLDGHIVLDRRLAQRGHFPPIDVAGSVSRLMPRVVSARHAEAAARVRAQLALYEEQRDLIALGAYQDGRDRALDAAVAAHPAIERAVRQPRDLVVPWEHSCSTLLTLAGHR
jgi:type III secretion protein N (ATPase)